LVGRHVLITAGPTHEPIDPVRYIANRSSGKQGFALAAAAAKAGARVTLVSGPVTLPTPAGVDRVDVETAREMAAAVEAALPADVAIMVAAVADWRVADAAGQKLKKDGTGAPPPLALVENPDILAGLCRSPRRPRWSSALPPKPTTSSPRPCQAPAQGGRLDRRQRRFGRGDGGRAQHRPHHRRGRGRQPARNAQGSRGRSDHRPHRHHSCPHRRNLRMTTHPAPVPILFKRLPHGEGLPLPAYATEGAAGMDVVAAEDVDLAPAQRHAVATGLALAIPHGYEIQVRPRSGLALKHGISAPNAPGTIDSDYRGELKIILINHGQESFAIRRGDRIAQLVLAPVTREPGSKWTIWAKPRAAKAASDRPAESSRSATEPGLVATPNRAQGTALSKVHGVQGPCPLRYPLFFLAFQNQPPFAHRAFDFMQLARRTLHGRAFAGQNRPA
jgi:phosphopantothenoylcysteine decarboxylase/phosphopantothenate--cysteine ligase